MSRIEEFIRELLPLHSEAAHTSEVCWLLFLARELKITLAADVLRGVTGLRSSACALVTMDLAQKNRIAGKLDTKLWRDFATAAGLRTEMWLAAYEITKKGWWGKPRSDAFIASHEYFSELLAKNVEFYETKRRARKVRPSVFKITRQTEGPVFSDPYR